MLHLLKDWDTVSQSTDHVLEDKNKTHQNLHCEKFWRFQRDVRREECRRNFVFGVYYCILLTLLSPYTTRSLVKTQNIQGVFRGAMSWRVCVICGLNYPKIRDRQLNPCSTISWNIWRKTKFWYQAYTNTAFLTPHKRTPLLSRHSVMVPATYKHRIFNPS